MCGITGIYQSQTRGPVGMGQLERMTRELIHRGPDDSGFFQAAGVGLGFRRLAIVDLQRGNQPLYSEDNSVAVVCNGEIYNHRELRMELRQRGHRFRTRCDIEVIPHLYQEFGDDLVRRLDGQFAFALYDKVQHRLLLGRDHVGIAPLFWSQDRDRVLFGSEIRAVLCASSKARKANLTALDQLLTFPGVVSPHTFFDGIHSLPPGHLLSIQGDNIELKQYWDLDYPGVDEQAGTGDIEGCLDELDGHLRAAVKRRLQGDVPVAVYLSGGLDSSLIAAMLAADAPGQVKHSFSITFPEPEIDERRFQQQVASVLGTQHHSFEVCDESIVDHLQAIVSRAEAPLRESYNVCSLLLSNMVHQQGMKVVLTGEGADELFAGYVGYRLDEYRDERNSGAPDLQQMLEQQVRDQLWGDKNLFYEKDYHSYREQKMALFSDAVAEQHGVFDCLETLELDKSRLLGRHPFHQRSYLDFKLRMADHLLSDHGDRVSFANSVEARYPFLDLNVINFVRTIAPQWLVKNGNEKWILKQLAKRYLPREIVDRRKFSFVAPSSAVFLRQQPEMVGDLLAPERIERQGYFNPKTVFCLREQYLAGDFRLNQTFDDDLLMVVLTFGIWLDEFSIPDFS